MSKSGKGHVPERMCTFCRKRGDKSTLIRVVRSPHGVMVDESYRMNGRGAYICNSAECIQGAQKNRSLNAALKCEVPKELWNSIQSFCH